MKNKLPERLQELRKEKNITRNQLMLKLRLGAETVRRWEDGETIPNAEYIFMLCEFFGCSADYLIGLKPD